MPDLISTNSKHSQDLISERLFWGFSIVLLFSIFIGVFYREYLFALVPTIFLIAYLAVSNFKLIYFLLLFSIPLSVEITFSGGFATDIPTEPLCILLLGIFIILLASRFKKLDSSFFTHPITLLLLLHYGWTLATMISSNDVFVSLKFFLAKTWYIAAFYFMTSFMIRTHKDFRQLFRVVFYPLTIVMMIVMFRHALEGFRFDEANHVNGPFFKNHVMYAAALVVFIPFIWFRKNALTDRSSKRFWLWGIILLYLAGIYFSYTRAAYICVVIAIGAYFVITYKLTRLALLGVLIGAFFGMIHLAEKDNFMDYAPEYDRAVSHTRFENLVEATYKGEDVSTMERVYRWVAGVFMVEDKPVLGFGPGNFFFFYRPYAVTSFKTYVSDNKEKSGIHNYYLMVAVEQGLPGLLIFLVLCFYAMIRGEKIYHQAKDPQDKRIIMTVLLCFIIINGLLLINDLIETDKVGSFFFISLAILVNWDIFTRDKLAKS